MFCPQQTTLPEPRSAQEWASPPTTPMAFVTPVTAVGERREVFVPSPNWPAEFAPQHTTTPAIRTAQEWLSPMPTATAPVRFVTLTGVSLGAVVPSPSSPFTLRPQQTTRPPETVAQVRRVVGQALPALHIGSDDLQMLGRDRVGQRHGVVDLPSRGRRAVGRGRIPQELQPRVAGAFEELEPQVVVRARRQVHVDHLPAERPLEPAIDHHGAIDVEIVESLAQHGKTMR